MRWLSDKKISHLRSLADYPDFSSTKYRIVKELARGGMATVYLAQDTELERQIAIKVLHTAESNTDLADRMLREARIIAGLEHPGIIPVHDVGMLADGRVFYAMKLVRGSRLDDYAARTGSLKDRLRKFQAVCEAVAFAHAHRVIHRDLKPQNIMIGTFGEVLVLDWGVAKVLRERRSHDHSLEADTLMLPGANPRPNVQTAENTAHGTIIGTPSYMSPEQARGEIDQLDAQSDVYSLGAILYFLLTSQRPAGAETSRANDRSEVKAITRPRELDKSISKTAEAVCLKAMAPSAAERYSTAAELAEDISNLLDAEPVSAYHENAVERAGRWIGKNRFLVLLVLAYLLMRIFFILTAHR